MSIYSGFATRQQQQSYDQLIQDLIFVLQKRVMKFYTNQETDQQKFLDVIAHLHNQMTKMEQHKYLQPKTSKSFESLFSYLAANTDGADQILVSNNKNANFFGNHKNSRNQMHGYTKSASNTVNFKIDKPITHRESFQMYSPSNNHISTSIGKIIKQYNVNHDTESQNNYQNIFQSPKNNSNQINNNPQKSFETNKKIFNKEKFDEKQKPREFLNNYLKNSMKNTFRNYRKRQVKVRNFSTDGKKYSNKGNF